MPPQPEQPNHGLRLTLDRAHAPSQDAVLYEGELVQAEGERITVEARFAREGAAEVRFSADVDPAVRRYVEGICRQIASGGRADGFWPRRVRRWRELG